MTIETDNARLELRIAKAVVEDAIAQRYMVSAYEGGDWAIKRSTDVAEVMAALASTDEDTLHFHDKATNARVGSVSLIWGNGWDLISDASWPAMSGAEGEARIDKITERADKIAEDAQEAYHANAGR